MKATHILCPDLSRPAETSWVGVRRRPRALKLKERLSPPPRARRTTRPTMGRSAAVWTTDHICRLHGG
eukprot:scaffold370405_cov40-Prasinocladus_malaysianus.AAC.2